jgi:WD40 repeat protein
MARVFLSHASADVAATDRVHGWLVEDGHEVFLDRHPRTGIAPGDEWAERLHERLRWADATVCLLTRAYAASTWCAAEVAVARSRGGLVVPVRVEAGAGHLLLDDLHTIEADGDDGDARRRLAGLLVPLGAGPLSVPDDLPPFPGLAPLDADRHRLFFGREADVAHLVRALRSPAERADAAMLLVVGPSGCGKSSLVRAGLVPALARDADCFTLTPVVPGADPAGAVLVELAEAGTRRLRRPDWSVEEVRHRSAEHGLDRVVDELLLAVPGPRRTRVLLVVDQFEELLTRSDATARTGFAALVGPALAGRLQVVATLRPEFLDPLLASAELAELRPWLRIHPLHPMGDGALRDVVQKPAELAGIGLEEGLVDRLVADTGSGEALPLLAYTLAQLADGVRRGGRLTLARYAQLGGVRRSITTQADRAMDEAVRIGGHGPEVVLRSLLRLVQVDEDGRPVRTRVPRAELAGALEPFLHRRLLGTIEVPGRDGRGEVVVGVAHEAFLTAWAPLDDAIRRDPIALRAQRRVERAARAWAAAGGPARLLWSGSQLTGAGADLGVRLRRTALEVARTELDALSVRFLRASLLRVRRRRRALVATLATLSLVMSVAAGVAGWQRAVADQERRVAVARQLLAQADVARAADARAALLLGIAAHELAPGAEADANLLETLTSTAYSRTLAGDEPVVAVAVAPERGTVAEGRIDGRVTLWDPFPPRRLAEPFAAHRGYLYDLEFSPSGRLLATGGADRTIGLWDVTDPAAPRSVGRSPVPHRDAVHAVAFSPDGRLLAAVDFAARLTVYDVTDPAAPVVRADVPTGHRGEVVDVRFAPDRPLLATAGRDGAVRLWDLAEPDQPAPVGTPLIGRDQPVWALAFAPDGRTLAAVDAEGYLSRWDVGIPVTPVALGDTLRVHAGAAYAVAFSPDGATVATAGADRVVRQWSVTGPGPPLPVGPPLVGHTAEVYSVAYLVGGSALVSGSVDRTAVLWDLTGADGPAGLGSAPASGNGGAMAVSPDGRRMATAGPGGTAALREVPGPDGAAAVLAPPPPGPSSDLRALAFSPEADLLAATTDDGRLVLWDTTGPGPPARLSSTVVTGGAALALAFAPDGRHLAIGGLDRSVSIWDAEDPTSPTRVGRPATDHAGPVTAVAFAPDGRWLASASADGSVLLRDAVDPAGPRWVRPALVGGGSPRTDVAFAPDGLRLAATGVDGALLVFALSADGRSAGPGAPLPAGQGTALHAVAFSADGSLLVTAGVDGVLVVRDVSDLRRPRVLGQPVPAGVGPVAGLAAVPGGARLAIAGADGRTALWNLGPLLDLRAHAVERACERTGRGLAPAEWAGLVDGVPPVSTCGSR